MNKQSAQDSRNTAPSLGFVSFWQQVAEELGSSRLKINCNANSIREILAPNSDHREYLRDIIQQSYRRSGCQKLSETVDLNVVLDILGETAFELQGQYADDLLDIELLEEIAWVISLRFSRHLGIESTLPIEAKTPSSGTVISLSKTKTLRANRNF